MNRKSIPQSLASPLVVLLAVTVLSSQARAELDIDFSTMPVGSSFTSVDRDWSINHPEASDEIVADDEDAAAFLKIESAVKGGGMRTIKDFYQLTGRVSMGLDFRVEEGGMLATVFESADSIEGRAAGCGFLIMPTGQLRAFPGGQELVQLLLGRWYRVIVDVELPENPGEPLISKLSIYNMEDPKDPVELIRDAQVVVSDVDNKSFPSHVSGVLLVVNPSEHSEPQVIHLRRLVVAQTDAFPADFRP